MLRAAIQRPIAISMLFLALLLIGVISGKRLPVDLLPGITYPRLTVVTSQTDVPAEDMERTVTQPIEEVVTALNGVRRVVSRTREGLSSITVEYEWGTQMDFANLHLREAVDRVAFRQDFPEDAARPVILRWDPTSRPISILVLEGDDPPQVLTEFATEVVKPALEQVDGISQAEIVGGSEREILVQPDMKKLAMYEISLTDIQNALARSNIGFPGGKIKRGPLSLSLRIHGEFENLNEIRQTDIPRAAGPSLRIQDIAVVKQSVKDPTGFTLLGDKPVISIMVYKEPEANTLQVSGRVDEALEQLGSDYGGFDHAFIYRDAEYVRASFQGLIQSLLTGAILAFFILFVFLRDWRSPAVIGLAIPVSIVITLGALYFGHVSLNLMSLGGLSLAAGMLVDNAIVVLENINRHLRFRPKLPAQVDTESVGPLTNPRQRAVADAVHRGTREMMRPVLAATLTTVAVFFPVVYVQGIAGAFFRDQALTVTFSLLVSVATALLLQPVLAARILKPGETKGIFIFFEKIFDAIHDLYHAALVRALGRPKTLLAFLLLGLGLSGVLMLELDRSFMPERSSGDLRVDMELGSGTPLEETEAYTASLGSLLMADPAVRTVFSQVGQTENTLAALREYTAPHTAKMRILLEAEHNNPTQSRRIQALIEEHLKNSATVSAAFREEGIGLGELLAAGEAPFSLGIVAENPIQAVQIAETLRHTLEPIEGLTDLQVDRVLGTTNLVVTLDREEILRSGLDPEMIAEELRSRVSGVEATSFNEVEQRVDIAVRLPREERRDLAGLLSMPLRLPQGESVSLGHFIHIDEERPVRELVRQNQRRMVSLSGNIQGRSVNKVWSDVRSALDSMDIPRNVMLVIGGEREAIKSSFRDLGWAMALAVLLVYMILAAQFESFLDPLLIAAVIPIGLAGGAMAIFVTGNSINILSMIGAVALLGIAVNDAIVKLDTIRNLRAKGMPGEEAILEASRLRFRPILMTSATTVLAMIPMAIGLGSGEQLQRPLAITIIGGLTLTTVLTLFYTPILYKVAHRLPKTRP